MLYISPVMNRFSISSVNIGSDRVSSGINLVGVVVLAIDPAEVSKLMDVASYAPTA